MVCGRCITTISEILKRLKIPFIEIDLGEVVLTRALNEKELHLLKDEVIKVGFEILDEKNDRLVNRIKSIIISLIYDEDDISNKNLSTVLSEEIHMDYSHLSSLFSRTEGKSIQQFQQNIKIERAKELLEYNEKPIAEIADLLGYGSAAYLSTTFKRATGLTPSYYRSLHIKGRKSLDSV